MSRCHGSPGDTSCAVTLRKSWSVYVAGRTSDVAARWVAGLSDAGDVEGALTALEVVAGGLVRRIQPREASDLIAQLPSELQKLGVKLTPPKQ